MYIRTYVVYSVCIVCVCVCVCVSVSVSVSVFIMCVLTHEFVCSCVFLCVCMLACIIKEENYKFAEKLSDKSHRLIWSHVPCITLER